MRAVLLDADLGGLLVPGGAVLPDSTAEMPSPRPGINLLRVQSTIRLPRDLDGVTDFRHELDEDLRAFGVDPGNRADVGLVVSEVCTNVVSHLGPGDQYDVEVEVDGRRCVIEVRDATAQHGSAPSDANVVSEAGHGLRIVSAVAADVEASQAGLVRRVAIMFKQPTDA
jgi:anti-sigma regulatory factor (Ser/Thr protein kinase)